MTLLFAFGFIFVGFVAGVLATNSFWNKSYQDFLNRFADAAAVGLAKIGATEEQKMIFLDAVQREARRIRKSP